MANNLTLREKIEIIRLSGENDRSIREVCTIFNERHPDRPPIVNSTVSKINNIFDEHGTVTKHIIRNQNGNIRGSRNDQVVVDYFTNNPRASLRDASLDLTLPRETIRRILQKRKIKPFKPKFLHTLEIGDEEKRMEFCLWAQGEYLQNRRFLKSVLFSDEATFTTNGVFSSQNARHWAVENPEWIVNCKRQYSFKINVWCGVLNERIIGPYFFENNLNSHLFLNFLRNEFWDAVEDLPLQERVNLHFQLDGCSVHNGLIVREWLNANFPNRWIGRNSTLIEWPPRSPDITPLDFFLWGVLKEKVYRSRPGTVDVMCDRIRQACTEITPDQLRNVMRNIYKRYEKCIQNNGGLIEMTII